MERQFRNDIWLALKAQQENLLEELSKARVASARLRSVLRRQDAQVLRKLNYSIEQLEARQRMLAEDSSSAFALLRKAEGELEQATALLWEWQQPSKMPREAAVRKHIKETGTALADLQRILEQFHDGRW